MLEENALPHEVDDPVYELGFAMGPLTMSDLAELDVG
jgi:3-hydroxyacyl-CoA dehydrogenase